MAAAALMAPGCGAQPDVVAEAQAALLPGGITRSVRTTFDSAAAALEAGDDALAHELFLAALAGDSTLAAAWIGLHLSSPSMPGSAGGDSALLRARSLIEPPPLPRSRTQAKPAT